MRKLLWICLFFSLCACGNVEQENFEAESPDLMPLSDEEHQIFEGFIVGGGRLERALLLQESDGANDPTLRDLRLALRSDACLIVDYLRPPALVDVERQTLQVSGNSCPLSASVEKINRSGQFNLRAQFHLLDTALATRNGIRSYTLSGWGHSSRNTNGRLRRVQFSFQGSMVDTTNTAVAFQVKTNKDLVENEQGVLAWAGTRSLSFSRGSLKAELKWASDGKDAAYFLNSDRITETQYHSYLSRLGPLLSGLLNEAG